MNDIEPERPKEAGVEEATPPTMQVEGARVLADDARPLLEGKGFSDDQIRRWADTYIAEVGSGDVNSFVAWIGDRQERS
ncbi:MAG TPA: hypothetical protein VFD47_05880 [Actinomycetota bacterium]|nr:hypothetical protein [Actinomycetota bacterium]